MAYYATFRLHFREEPALRTIKGDKADDTVVNFGFETFVNAPVIAKLQTEKGEQRIFYAVKQR